MSLRASDAAATIGHYTDSSIDGVASPHQSDHYGSFSSDSEGVFAVNLGALVVAPPSRIPSRLPTSRPRAAKYGRLNLSAPSVPTDVS